MFLKRFEKISRYLHVSNRSREIIIGPRNIEKVKWLWDHVESCCQKWMLPQRCQSIDEAMASHLEIFRFRIDILGIKLSATLCCITLIKNHDC